MINLFLSTKRSCSFICRPGPVLAINEVRLRRFARTGPGLRVIQTPKKLLNKAARPPNRRGKRLAFVLLTLACLIAPPTLAHDQIPGAPQTRPIVIKDAIIHVIDGPVIQKGSVLFEDGRITAVGNSVATPDKAIEIDGTGKHVYPGLIESMTDLGLREISAVDATDDRTEFGDRNPNARSWVAVNPDSELIPVARAGGVLVAMTAPLGRWMRGQSAVMYLDGWTISEMAILAPAGLYVDWGAMNPRDDDDKKRRERREQKMTEFDALLDEARRYGEAREKRPDETPTDVRLESLLPLIAGEQPLIAEADLQSEIESAVAYAQQQGLRLVIYGGYDAAECSALLNKYQVPVIIAATYRLPKRRDDAYDAAYTLPQRLRRAGVHFAIGGAGAGSPGGAAAARNLPYHAGAAVAYGLPHAEALRAITLSAAEILGVSDRIGSITVGKDATLIITDGDILETKNHVTAAFIQGRVVDLGSRHKTLFEKYKQKYSRR
jgi:imidazolonepropionase-like amidohydrolase